MAVDLVRLMRIPALVPPVVVVGVGYPSDDSTRSAPSHHGLHPDGGVRLAGLSARFCDAANTSYR
jgi:hypothetical protein